MPLSAKSSPIPLYRNVHASLNDRANDLYNRLTENDKLSLLTGTGYTSQPIPRLKLAGINMADAGQGVRGGGPDTQGPATSFPCGLDNAASWDPSLFWQIGKAIGEEAKNKGDGIQMELAPGVNIERSPLNGRTSEYLGEDPYLSAHLDVPFIEGIQSTGIAACVKHYACNNEEGDRQTVNVHVSERALREIYLPAFEAAVTKAHVDAIMSSYNRINGPYATASYYLLHEVLRQDWGFDGLALSDWGAVHEAAGAVNAGLDLEMPGPGILAKADLQQAIHNGSIKQSQIDSAVKQIVRAMIICGLADPVQHVPDHSVVDSLRHRELAYKAALEGIVLLKNSGSQLPLNANAINSIAIIGVRAKQWQINTGGSPFVTPSWAVNGYDGIADRLGAHSRVHLYYAAGYNPNSEPVPTEWLSAPNGESGLKGSYYPNMTFSGKPLTSRLDQTIQYFWNTQNRPAGIGPFNFSVRWIGELRAPSTGLYTFIVSADDGCRLWIGGKEIINHWQDGGATPINGLIRLVQGKIYSVRLDYYQHGGGASVTFNWLPPSSAQTADAAAAAIAKKASIAIVFAGTDFESEGVDRASMALPDKQDQLINDIVEANPNTIVVLNNGGPVLMSKWTDQVPAILEVGFPGEMGGTALASILFGDSDPSGKLAETIAVRRRDYPDYPNFPGDDNEQVYYREGIYVGYRGFDRRNVTPLFPFGYGLSYTTFGYTKLSLSTSQWDTTGSVDVAADITNTGQREGAEIAQLYVEPQSPLIDRPIRELKGFDRVDLLPGQTKTVHFTLYPRDFAYCDVPGKQWRADAGSYLIDVAASSRDIKLQAPLSLTSTWTDPIPGLGEPDPNAQTPSLTTGRPASASSTMHYNFASYAFDGNAGSRWESHWCSPQWLSVNLGAIKTVSRVTLVWDSASAQAYRLQVSDDYHTWRTVYSTSDGKGGIEKISFPPTNAKYVRFYGLRRSTSFGYSLYSFDVY